MITATRITNTSGDVRVPEWHAWHAARRGLGSNLYRLGVLEKVAQSHTARGKVNVIDLSVARRIAPYDKLG